MQQSMTVVSGSDLIAGHGLIQPVIEDADLGMETDRDFNRQEAG